MRNQFRLALGHAFEGVSLFSLGQKTYPMHGWFYFMSWVVDEYRDLSSLLCYFFPDYQCDVISSQVPASVTALL